MDGQDVGLAVAFDLAGRGLDQGKGLGDLLEIGLSGVGQGDGAGVAVKQAEADALFQEPIWWLMADAVTCSSCAAAVNDPRRAAASKACRDFSEGMRLIPHAYRGGPHEANSKIACPISFEFTGPAF